MQGVVGTPVKNLRGGTTSRKLYALCVIESHSRMLYVIFTHSQNQETLHRCLVEAFIFLGALPKRL